MRCSEPQPWRSVSMPRLRAYPAQSRTLLPPSPVQSPRLRLAPPCSRARLRAAVAELGVVRRRSRILRTQTMNTDYSSDSRFLRRWQRWHRLGWPFYLICSIASSTVIMAISVCCVRNLFDHGITFAAWHGLTRADCFIVAGVVFASVTTMLGHFTSSEARYERLSQSNRNA